MSLSVVPFTAERHGAFVYDTFARSLSEQWPWKHLTWQTLWADLKRHIAHPDTVTNVAEVEGVDGAFAGWACTAPPRNEVIYAYTRHAYRRRFKCMTTLLERGRIATDETRPVPVRYWTRATERIALATGWSLYWRVTEDT